MENPFSFSSRDEERSLKEGKKGELDFVLHSSAEERNFEKELNEQYLIGSVLKLEN